MFPKPLTPPAPPPAKLAGKQERFVAEYLVDLNASAAARRAGYKQGHVQGPRLLGRPAIAAAITLAQSERARRARVTADWIIDRLRVEALATGRGNSQAGRVKALELLGRHLGMFRDKLDVNVRAGGVEVVETLVTSRAEAKQILAALDRFDGRLPEEVVDQAKRTPADSDNALPE